MKKTTPVILFLSMAAAGLSAQTYLQGTLTVEGEETSPAFTNIVVYEPSDSLATARATISDIRGHYRVGPFGPGDYLVQVSQVGCATITEPLSIDAGSGELVTMDFRLVYSAVDIDAVSVSHTNIGQFVDKTVYTVTAADAKLYPDGLELIKKVPQLRIDPVSKRIQSFKDGGVKILLNGANATEEQLMALTPDKVREIEYYDFPPARFSGYGTVVNIRTKEPVNGLDGGANVMHALSTGFGNDGMYLNFARNRHKLSLSYNLYYRDYDNDVRVAKYDYELGGQHYARRQESDRRFGYSSNFITLSYTNLKVDEQVFQVDFRPDYQKVHSDQDDRITNRLGSVVEDRIGNEYFRNYSFTPSLDIYYWKKLGTKHEVLANLVGTYHNVKDRNDKDEFLKSVNLPVLTDHRKTHNTKYSIIGEAGYVLNTQAGSFTVGNKTSWEDLDSKTDNILGVGKYNTNILTNYTYAQFSGTVDKFMYRASAGGTYRHTENYLDKSSDYIFTPQVLLRYAFTTALSLSASFTQSNLTPSLGQLSDNPSLVDENIVDVGNPLLKNGFYNSTQLQLMHSKDRLTFYVSGSYDFHNNPINQFFIEDSSGDILRTYENARNIKTMRAGYGFSVKPFPKDLLVLQLEGSVNRRIVHSPIVGKNARNYYPLMYNITLNIKDFTVSYYGHRNFLTPSGPYLVSNEPASHLSASYRWRNFTFQAMCYWLGSNARYRTETIPTSIVQYSHMNTIKDNANMVALGLSYKFSAGKGVSSHSKKLQNSDRDSGI